LLFPIKAKNADLISLIKDYLKEDILDWVQNMRDVKRKKLLTKK
jgi:hypothetical protein